MRFHAVTTKRVAESVKAFIELSLKSFISEAGRFIAV